MTAIVKVTNFDGLMEQLEKIAYSLDSIASILTVIAKKLEKEGSE